MDDAGTATAGKAGKSVFTFLFLRTLLVILAE
jgi:hypothetical protein